MLYTRLSRVFLFMRSILYFVLLFLATVASYTAASQAKPVADLKKLAADPYWLKLMRYKKSPQGFVSEITSQPYFLSSVGKVDPLAELLISVDVLFSEPDSNNHPRCQFVERFRWLNQQLKLNSDAAPYAKCREYKSWANHKQLQSASLVYASGYLGNPASFFGHSLLKLNYQNKLVANDALLDTSINFGAAVPPEDGPLVYVIKGFLGGYQAGFQEDSFFRHHRSYAQLESRTLWEYPLKLTDMQLQQLVGHIWELRSQAFQYFYLDENCASRIAELIDVVADTELEHTNLTWVQPIDVFKRASNSPDLLAEVVKHSSLYDQYIEQYQRLPANLQSLLPKLITPVDFTNQAYMSLNQQHKVAVVDTLLSYFDYQQQLRLKDVAAQRQAVLKQRFKLPPSPKPQQSVTAKPPHLTNGTSAVRLALNDNELSLQLRPTYYDLLANEDGRLPYSQLQFFNATLGISGDSVELTQLDIIDIISLSPSVTSLKNNTDFSWRLNWSFNRDEFIQPKTLSMKLAAGAGKSIVTKVGLLYGLAQAEIHSTSLDKHRGLFTGEFGLISDINDQWRSQFIVNTPIAQSAGLSIPWAAQWQNRLAFDYESDWRFGIKVYEPVNNIKKSELSVSYTRYF